MATVIKIKKSTGATAPTALGNGEMGYTQATGTSANGGERLYIGAGTESGGEADHIDIIGGKYYTDILATTAGTLTADTVVIPDSNKKMDNWIVDNIDINGNTISTTDSAGDLILSPQGAGDINVDSSKIINLADPSAAQDAATKAYVDATSSGLDVKASCELATAAVLSAVTYANGSSGVGATLTADANGALTVDGVAAVVADRIVVKNQAAALQNGIYTVTATGAVGAVFVLTRATDFDDTTNITSGAFTFVEKGTANADNGYVMTTDGTITPGVTAIAWSQFSGAGMVTAGDGLDKTGNVLSVNVDDTSIAIAADTLEIKSTYVGQTSLTTLGTIATGTWNGTAVADAYVANALTIVAGTVNNSVIGGSTPAAGTFTTLVANTSITGTLATATQNSVTTMTGLTTVGTVAAGQFGTDAAPLTVYSNAGEIDGNVIGSETPAAGTFTTVTVNDLLSVNAGLAIAGDTTGEITLTVTGVGSQTANLMTVEQSDGTDKLQVSAAGVTTAASLVATTADINAGTFDGVVGGTTPAAGSFTTLAGTLSTAAQNSITSATSLASVGTVTTGVWQGTDVGVAHGGTGLSAAAKGSVLIANAADTISALDGGGSNDGLLYYTASADTIAWATSLDGGTF